VTGPLAERVVLITRPAAQARDLAARLRALGAEVLVAPAIEVHAPPPGGPLDDAIREAAGGRFDWVAFTSAAGVRAWLERAAAVEAGPPRARVAAVGDATAESLREAGVEAHLVPATFTTVALGRAFPQGPGRVLLPRADLATGELEDALRRKGWTPVRVDAYRVVPVDTIPGAALRALEEERVDAVTFTSPSTVNGFVRAAEEHHRPAAVCIGPVTAEAARRAGFRVTAVAEPHTTDGLVDATVSSLR
jgi:uroporphyrinogen-III synthase